MTREKLQSIKQGEVRTRIAPSPTGFFHIGNARTALFNYLFAKKNKGVFVLRIEDTDIERSKPEFEESILKGLKWLGLEWDEGPGKESKIGSYRQSERTEIYRKYLEKLLAENKAYYCFCEKEELEAQRQYQLSLGKSPCYSGKCAGLSEETVKHYLSENKPSVIRFRVESKIVKFKDIIRGDVEFDASLMGDIVIAKNLQNPLYNFSVAVDDYEMNISHVIRGEDHLSNTPKQILIQEALGFPKVKYAHLPLILGPDRSKMSKRHAAVSVSEYKKLGYLPEALINFMAFLGWNPGGEKEIYSMDSLIEEFSLEKIQKGGAIFNIARLNFLNGLYIRQYPIDKLTDFCVPYLSESGLIEKEGGEEDGKNYKVSDTGEKINFDYLEKIISIHKERMKILSEITELTDFFFKGNLGYEKDLLKWKKAGDKEAKESLVELEKILSGIKSEEFQKENLEKVLMPLSEQFGKGDRGSLLWPLRAALSGKKSSAGPFEIAEILGKEKVLQRIKFAQSLL